MRTLTIGGCTFDIIPIVKGLQSYSEQVSEALENNTYDAASVALGIEEVESIRRRSEIEGEYESSDLDLVYSHLLKDFGPIDMPDPSFTALIDRCSEMGIPVIPLDMNDEDYTRLYCDTVTTMEFLREKRIIKKAMKKEFDKSSPEAFVTEWDALINEIKGYARMSAYREEYIAGQIIDTAKYRKHVLTVIEYERLDGILSIIGGEDGL